MEITEGRPYQGLSSQLAFRWRRFAQAWPLFVVILGVVLSFGWTAILVWVVGLDRSDNVKNAGPRRGGPRSSAKPQS